MSDFKDETWLPIPGYEDTHEVSDHGRVRRIGNPPLRPSETPQGYLTVTLNRHGTPKIFTVHKLVLLAFVGNCPPGHNRNHKDLNKGNNALENLEYTTYAENTAHAIRSGVRFGRSMKGERNPRSKLSVADVMAIRERLSSGISPTIIAAELNVPRRAVYSLKYGLTWRHLEQPGAPREEE